MLVSLPVLGYVCEGLFREIFRRKGILGNGYFGERSFGESFSTKEHVNKGF